MSIAAVARHLNIVESAIAEIQEWAHVLFVKFTAGRPRFVSKKIMEVIVGKPVKSRIEAVEIVKSELESCQESYSAKIWAKGGKVRVYIKDLKYRNSRAQDRDARPGRNLAELLAR